MKIKSVSAKKAYHIGILGFTLWLIIGCDPQKTAREKANLQYINDKQTKFRELEPAEGTFSGIMHLLSSNQDFKVQIKIKRVSLIERAPQSQNPSETIEVPKLSGSMTFPALSHLQNWDYTDFQELLSPMGGLQVINFDYGDYRPLEKNLILPYSIPGYSQGNYGEISGVLEGNHFHGNWFANPIGDVGTFDVKKVGSGGVSQQ